MIKKIHIGTWFQRTDLHLREIYNFLARGEASDKLNQDKLVELKNAFGDFQIEFNESLVNYILLKIPKKELEIEITEDGIVLLSKDYKEQKADIEVLKTFYEDVLSPTINYLFSLGAPLPKELASIKLVFPFFFVGLDITKEMAEKHFSSLDDSLISTIESKKVDLYVGSVGNILSFKKESDLSISKELIKYGVFFREFEIQLSQYLRLHREIWEEMDEIRTQKSIKRGDFAKIRNQLMSRKKFLAFVQARLNQMEHLITERENNVEAGKIREELGAISWDSFASLNAAHKYILDLWGMTTEYVDSTVQLLEIFYQENTQRELFALEIITLLSTIIGLVTFFKTSNPFDLVLAIAASIVFFITLKYLIRGQAFTLPSNQ